MKQRQHLQAEGGERGGTAADAGQNERLGVERHVEAAVRTKNSPITNEPVDEQRSPRKGGAEQRRPHHRGPVGRRRRGRCRRQSTDSNPQIGGHSLTSPPGRHGNRPATRPQRPAPTQPPGGPSRRPSSGARLPAPSFGAPSLCRPARRQRIARMRPATKGNGGPRDASRPGAFVFPPTEPRCGSCLPGRAALSWRSNVRSGRCGLSSW